MKTLNIPVFETFPKGSISSHRSHTTYIKQIMAATVYHGVAKNVYVAKEAIIGLSLGLIAGSAWKYSHWQRRSEIASYYEKQKQAAKN
jgi:hypothetical protein